MNQKSVLVDGVQSMGIHNDVVRLQIDPNPGRWQTLARIAVADSGQVSS